VYFIAINERWNCLADDLQYRRDFADDVFPVSPSPFFFRSYDLDLT
jgi:hypothetical protein